MRILSSQKHQSPSIDAFSQKLVQASGTSDQDFLFVEPYSIGDLVHDLVLIPEFRRQHCRPGQKINLICNPRATPLVNAFPGIDNVFGMNCGAIEPLLSAISERYGPCNTGSPVVLAPDMYARGWLGRLAAKGMISPITAKKLILEIDIDSPVTLPNLKADRLQDATARAIAQGITPGSLIIFNHAKTVKPIESSAFTRLVETFAGKIFFDASVADSPAIEGATPLQMTLEEIPYFASLAGNVVALRSGITDLLCMAQTSLVTILPKSAQFHDWAGDKAEAARAFRHLSLQRLGLDARCRENIVSYEEGESPDSLAEKIIDAVVAQQRP